MSTEKQVTHAAITGSGNIEAGNYGEHFLRIAESDCSQDQPTAKMTAKSNEANRTSSNSEGGDSINSPKPVVLATQAINQNTVKETVTVPDSGNAKLDKNGQFHYSV